jgi:isochorismate pyruvate lyase
MNKTIRLTGIEQIRREIDTIDKKIIFLIGKRSVFVKHAAKFKKDTKSVKAKDRVKAMLVKRREWAIENNVNPDVIEKMYKMLVHYFVNEELKQWGKKL